MGNKYKLLENEKITHSGKTLHRIQAVKDFGNIKKGDTGGYIETQANLSQRGNAWVYEDAKVYGDAEVSGNAGVSGDAWVYGNAKVYEDAKVYGDAEVSGNAGVSGNAWVYGNAKVYGNAWVRGDAWVYGNAKVYGNAWVRGDAWVYGNARVYGNAGVYGDAKVYEDAKVFGDAEASGNAGVSGNAWVYGNAKVSGNVWVHGNAICTRTPFTCVLTNDYITVTDRHVAIGCEQHTFKHWLKHIEDIGKKYRYTEQEIKAYKVIVFQMIEAKTGKQLVTIDGTQTSSNQHGTRVDNN